MPDAQIYVQDYHVRPEKVRRQSTAKKQPPKIGDPTALGLSAFAISMMISALYNLQVLGIRQGNVLVGVALFTGGLVQFASGMWCYRVGSTFGGTGFSAYGGFWLSYAILFIPGFGIRAAFGNDDDQYHNAVAIYLLAWLIFTVIFTLACMRTNAGVLAAFIFLSITFAAEVIYNFSPTNDVFIKFAGVTGLITSIIVYYCLAATFLTPDLSPISLPLWDLSKKEH